MQDVLEVLSLDHVSLDTSDGILDFFALVGLAKLSKLIQDFLVALVHLLDDLLREHGEHMLGSVGCLQAKVRVKVPDNEKLIL